MIWQYAGTLAICSGISAYCAAKLDSPFPRIITRWTYVAGVGKLTCIGSLFVASIALLLGK